MFSRLRRLVLKIFLLALLIAAAWVGWRWGDAVFPRVEAWLGVAGPIEGSAPPPSPELADSILDRIQEARGGVEGVEVAVDGRGLTSLLRYSASGYLPRGVVDPVVRLEDGQVGLKARVALDDIPDLPDLSTVLGLLPDTMAVEAVGDLLPFGEGSLAFLVRRVEASRVPLPRRMVPRLLRAFGRRDEPGLPPEAIAVPLPPGLAGAYIRADSLILSFGSQVSG